MMPAYITIKDCTNGTLVKVRRDGLAAYDEYVIQGSDDERREVEAWREALSVIYDDYGPGVSRHSAARLWLTVAPGDKHKDFEDTLFQ